MKPKYRWWTPRKTSEWLFSSTFKTFLPCQQAANRIRRILFWLCRGFTVLTPEIFWALYLSLVRPVLEYSQQASSPYLRRDIVLVERTQRLATRLALGMQELPYEDRLRRLNIFSLERRRLRGDLILAYNILHGCLDLPEAGCFEVPAERNLRGLDFKLRHRSFHLLRRKAVFSVKLPISWNKLAIEIVDAPTLDDFKRPLDSACSFLFPSLPWLPRSFNLNVTLFAALNITAMFDQYIWVDMNNSRIESGISSLKLELKEMELQLLGCPLLSGSSKPLQTTTRSLSAKQIYWAILLYGLWLNFLSTG